MGVGDNTSSQNNTYTFWISNLFGQLFYCKGPNNALQIENQRGGEDATDQEKGEESTSLSDSAWMIAVKSQDLVKVQEMIDSGTVDINQSDQHGWSALHIAAWNGYTSLCTVLLESSHCNRDLTGPGQSTPLSLACQTGHTDIVAMLLKAKCNVHKLVSLGENYDVTVLHLAAQNGHVAIVRQLLEAGVGANVTMRTGDVGGVTPLHLAVEAGHLEVMDLLIEAGSDVRSTTKPNKETEC